MNENLHQPTDAVPPMARPTGVRWLVFTLCCGTSWVLYLHRYTFGLIKGNLAKEWNVGEVELGLMDTAFSLAYSSAQIPCGLLADLIGTHLFLSAAIIGWSCMLAMHAFTSHETIYAVRFFFGLAQAGCYPCLSKVSRAWFPRSVRTTLQGWVASFFGRIGGAASGLLFATLLIGQFGLSWRMSLVVFAVLGGLLGLLLMTLFRSTPEEHPKANDAERQLIESEELPPIAANATPPRSLGAREVLRGLSPRSAVNFGIFLVQQFTSTFADMIYVAWVPFFLQKEHKLDFTEMGIFASLPLLGGACGGMVGGYLNDWLIRRLSSRRWARSLVGFTGKAIACGLIFVALAVYDHPYVFCGILFWVKFFSDWSQPTVWGTVTDISGRATGTVFGMVNSIGGLGGLLSPVVFALVAKAQGWGIVFGLVGVAYLISSASWLLVNCTIPLVDESKLDRTVDA